MKRNYKALSVFVVVAIALFAAIIGTSIKASADKETKGVEKKELESETQRAVYVLNEDRTNPAIVAVDSNSVALAASNDDEKTEYDDRIVSYLSPYVYVYTSQDIESEPVAMLFPETSAKLLEKGTTFSKVSVDGVEGFVKNEQVLFGIEAYSIAKEDGKKIPSLAVDETLIYSLGNYEAYTLGTLTKDMTFEVLSYEGEFDFIEYDGQNGYIPHEKVHVSYYLEEGMSVTHYNEYLAEQERIRAAEEEAIRLAEEERQRQAQEAYVEAAKEKYVETVQGSAYNLTEEEIWLVACLVKYESGWEPYEGKLAVANVIMNRIAGYGSVSNVAYAPYQFSGVSDGNYGPSDYFRDNYLNQELTYRLTQSNADECMKATLEAASGINNIGDYRYFIGNSSADYGSYSSYVIIGGHTFYAY